MAVGAENTDSLLRSRYTDNYDETDCQGNNCRSNRGYGRINVYNSLFMSSCEMDCNDIDACNYCYISTGTSECEYPFDVGCWNGNNYCDVSECPCGDETACNYNEVGDCWYANPDGVYCNDVTLNPIDDGLWTCSTYLCCKETLPDPKNNFSNTLPPRNNAVTVSYYSHSSCL